MNFRLPLAIALALACTSTAWADDECHRPVAQWQPREAVAAHVAAQGITIDRLHIDDGCYELRGRDADGNRLHLTLDPVTLEILSMRVRFRQGVPSATYSPGGLDPGCPQPKPSPPNSPTTNGRPR